MKVERAFTYYWMAVLGVVTFFNFSSFILPRYYKNYIFLFAGLASLVLFGIRKYPKHFRAMFGILFLLATINQHHQWTSSAVSSSAFFAVGVGVFFQFFSFWNKEDEKIIYTALGFFGIFQCIWIFVNYLGFDIYSLISGTNIILLKTNKAPLTLPITGSMGHWMVSGSFLAMTIPFILRLGAYLIAPILLAVYLLPSGIPPVAIATMLGAYIMHYNWRKSWVWLVGLSATVLSYVILKPYGVFEPSERVKIWEYATVKFKVNPIIGEGFGYFRDLFSVVFKEKFVELHRHPHNEFVSIYVAFGLIGVLITLYILVICIKKFELDKVAVMSVIGSIVPMLFGFPLHVAGTALVLMISLASILSKGENITA